MIISLISLSISTENYRQLASLHARYSAMLNKSSTGKDLLVSLLRAKALLAINRSQNSSAIAAFEKALRIDNNAIWLRLDYARLLLKLNRREDAEKVASKIPVVGADKKNGSYAYLLGSFTNEKDANEFLQQVLKARYPSAKVIKYLRGNRLTE